MMGLLVIHGAQGGGFSPISVYGGITNKVVEKAGLDVTEMAVFLTSLGFNLMMAIICFCAFGGLKLMRRQEVSLADAQYVAVADDQASSARSRSKGMAPWWRPVAAPCRPIRWRWRRWPSPAIG